MGFGLQLVEQYFDCYYRKIFVIRTDRIRRFSHYLNERAVKKRYLLTGKGASIYLLPMGAVLQPLHMVKIITLLSGEKSPFGWPTTAICSSSFLSLPWRE